MEALRFIRAYLLQGKNTLNCLTVQHIFGKVALFKIT